MANKIKIFIVNKQLNLSHKLRIIYKVTGVTTKLSCVLLVRQLRLRLNIEMKSDQERLEIYLSVKLTLLLNLNSFFGVLPKWFYKIKSYVIISFEFFEINYDKPTRHFQLTSDTFQKVPKQHLAY